MNAARDLANTGTPGPWWAHDHEPWYGDQAETIRLDAAALAGTDTAAEWEAWDATTGSLFHGDVVDKADTIKIVRAVNALPAWADYDDAMMAYLKHQTECTVGPLCVRLDRLFGELTRKRAAVEAVLRGES